MLAALAASGLTPPSSRFGLTEALARASAAASEAGGAAASSASVSRRRSLRLSAKLKAAGASTEASGEASEPADSVVGVAGTEASSVKGASEAPEGESVASVAEPAPSETVVNDDEFAADFTDDELDVDAEVSFLLANDGRPH